MASTGFETPKRDEDAASHGAPVTGSEPQPTYEELLARMTEYERQQKQSRLDRERLLDFIDSLPEDIYVSDAQGQIVLVNEAVRAILGVDHPETLTTSVARASPADSLPVPPAGGKPRPGVLRVDTMDAERKRHEQELHQRNLELEATRLQAISAKRRLEAVMDALPVGVAITDAVGGNIQSNSEFDRIWSGPRPAIESVSDYRAYKAWWAETGRPLAPEEWASALVVQKGERAVGQLLELERFDGSRVCVINSAAPIRDASGAVVGSAVALQDVSELRQAQRALRESEERFRVALQDSPVTLGTLDCELRYTWVHNTRHGFTPDDVIGKRPDELIAPEDAAELMAMLRRVLETGQRARREVSGKTRGERWDYLAIVEPLRDDEGRVIGLRLAQIDITNRKRAEEMLRASEERHRLALSAGQMATWDWHLQTGEVTWNDEHFRMLGYEPASVQPSYSAWAARVHPEDRPRTEKLLQSSLERGGEYVAEFRVRWPDGVVHWVEARGRVEHDPTGKPSRQYGVMLDVTERKRAEEQRRDEQRQLRWVLDVTGVGLWLNELPLGALNWDPRTHELFFVQPDEKPSIDLFWQRVHPDDREPTRLAVETAIREHTAYSIDHRAVHPQTGQVRWIRSAGQATYDESGNPIRFDGVNYDISERKFAEAALREANERLCEADRRKDDFLAVLSHELRNPLTPIQNSLFILRRAAQGGDQAKRAQAIIERQLSHITRLVDDLLDATRIARGKMQIRRERLEFGELVRRAVEDHRAVFATVGIELEASVTTRPVWILGDPTRLFQVIGNLLQNAAKFTPTGGLVEASLWNADGAAVLQVRDTGIGIASDLLERVFEPFVQADQALDRHFGGLGLGLALAKTIVEQHGGAIQASSDGPGHGATLTIRLPLDVQGSPKTTTTAPGVHRHRRILIIEDNVDAADSLQDVLELNGHTVAVSYTGAEGVRIAREFLPEVVLCDIGLPELDGYAVARAFRVDEVLRGMSLVALTGYALPEDIAKAIEAGFDSHVAKPPSLETLEEVIEQCEKDRAERSRRAGGAKADGAVGG